MRRDIEKNVEIQRQKNTDYTPMTEKDYFKYNGENQFSVLDVWRYAHCLLENDVIAEYLVAKSLNIIKAENITYWTAYDMSYKNKRIEVKSTAYVHAWNTSSVSEVRTFSIEPSKNIYWDNSELVNNDGTEASRQSDIYVFCLNADKDIKNHDPFNLNNWEFYVVPTYKINSYAETKGNPNQKKISLNVIRELLADKVQYDGLFDAIEACVIEVDNYYNNEN
ncbi:MAG: hypothetical protein E7262_05550 [Lachnospiraceae bacterium]|nr:hypothetical protein [Lachnospiraceae bacterium]